MATVTVITGLSGSGKTYLGKEMERAGAKLLNEGVRPDMPHNWPLLFDALAAGRNCAIVEIAYLIQSARDKLQREVRKCYPETKFEWVFFENDLKAANWNCMNDPDRSPEKIAGDLNNNADWTRLYEIPGGADVRKIFQIPKLDR